MFNNLQLIPQKWGIAPAAQPSSGWNGRTYGKFRSTKGRLGKQERSPWLLILRLHSCVVSYAPVFDTTSPGNRATIWTAAGSTASWESHPREDLSRPPSLRGPRFTGGWDGTEVSLSLTESLRYSPPQAVLWTDGSARHLVWPSWMQTQSAQVVLAHPPASLALVQRAPSGRYPDHRVFGFQGPQEETPSLLSRVQRGVENQNFKFSSFCTISSVPSCDAC